MTMMIFHRRRSHHMHMHRNTLLFWMMLVLLLLVSPSRAHESCCKGKLAALGGGSEHKNTNEDDAEPEFIVDPVWQEEEDERRRRRSQADNGPASIDVDSNGNVRLIPDPDASKPPYWDDEDDGIWEAHKILNPKYTEWKETTTTTTTNSATPKEGQRRMIRNPKYVRTPTYWDKLITEIVAALPWVTLGILLTGLWNTVLFGKQLGLFSDNGLFRAMSASPSSSSDGIVVVLSSVLMAALLGLITPLCSCGTLPLAAGFMNHGIPLASTVAFLTASQSAGLDSAAITWGLLGPTAAIARLVGAVILAVSAGLATEITATMTTKTLTTTTTTTDNINTTTANNSGTTTGDHATNQNSCNSEHSSSSTPCCASDNIDENKDNSNSKDDNGGVSSSALSILCNSSLTKLWMDASETAMEIFPTVLLGLVGSTAVLHYFASTGLLSRYYGGQNLVVRIGLLLLATPLQLCEHSTVTLAAAIPKAGGSTGLAFAFLLSAPATNGPTLLFLLQYAATTAAKSSTTTALSSSSSPQLVVFGIIAAMTVSALLISYVIDAIGIELFTTTTLDNKNAASEMAELPTWYISIVPYIATGMVGTGVIRSFFVQYTKSTATTIRQQDDCCNDTTGGKTKTE